MIKKTSILLFVFLLIGCNKTSDIETYILYSNRFDGENSVLIGYSEDGHISKEIELNGFRYQNIGIFQKELYVNNGNSMYTFDSDLNTINIRDNDFYTDSSIEMNGFNSNNETFYYIDNVGFIDNSYINHIYIGLEKSKIVIEGFITAHFLVEDKAFFIYQDPSQIEEGNFTQFFAKVDLNTNSIIEQGALINLPACFSVNGQPYNSDNNTIYFTIDSYNVTDISNNDSTIITSLVEYNIQTMELVRSYEISRFSEASNSNNKHLLKSDSVYFYDNKIKILYNDGTLLTLTKSFEIMEKNIIETLVGINPVLTHYNDSNNALSILNFENNEPKLYKFDFSTNVTSIESLEISDETLGLVPYYFIK